MTEEKLVRLSDLRKLLQTDAVPMTDYSKGIHEGIRYALQVAADMQPVEAEPVRHGRWDYRHEDDWCYCSVCGTDAEGSDGECLETKYCPNCGARMDGGAENGS